MINKQPSPEELAKNLLQTTDVKLVVPVMREPVNPMETLHRIVTENARRQQAYHEPNLDRKREDPKTKKRNKIAAQSRRRNRRK
jgi:hypothetical protein